jgi:hypothetical protein
MSLFGRKPSDEEETFSTEDLGDEYYVEPVDPLIHTPDNPFCDDMSCPCHEDQESINDLTGYYQDGLASRDDADHIYRGQTLR